MFLRYIYKHIKRSLATNILFCLLLALSGALLSLALSIWFSAHKGIVDIDDYFTTIAIPETATIRAYSSLYAGRNNLYEFTTPEGETITLVHEKYERVGEQTIGEFNAPQFEYTPGNEAYFNSIVAKHIEINIMKSINDNVFESGAYQLDDRRIMAAYSPGLVSVPLRNAGADPGNANRLGIMKNLPQSSSAFIAKCVNIEENYINVQFNIYNESLNSFDIFDSWVIMAEFEIEESIYLHEAYYTPPRIFAEFFYTNPDGTMPVEVEKRYILSGRYANEYEPSIFFYEIQPQGHFLLIEPINQIYDDLKMGEIDLAHYRWIAEEYGYNLNTTHDADIIPINAKLPIRPLESDSVFDLGYPGQTWFEIEGTLADALSLPQGGYIETALSVPYISSNSLMVLATDNMDSLVRFNQRRSSIANGRAILPSEYSEGNKVAIISSELAALNGLSVGDYLDLQFYGTSLERETIYSNAGSLMGYVWYPGIYHPAQGLTEPEGYEIVGIFDTIAFELSDYAIPSNMIIVPSASAPEIRPLIDYIPDFDPPILKTVIVPNKDLANIRRQLESSPENYGIFFRYYDQGFSAVLHSMTNLRTGMAWILALTLAGWVLAAIIFIVFFVDRKKQESRLLYAFGVGNVKRFCWVFIQAAIIIIISQGISVAAAMTFYEDILNTAAQAAEDFTDPDRYMLFSDSSDAEGIRNPMPIFTYPAAMAVSAISGALVLLVVSGFYIVSREPSP